MVAFPVLSGRLVGLLIRRSAFLSVESQLTGEASIKVAIVGAGPSGFYAAQALLDASPDCAIDIVERLATPYGLIRSGVAPDHPTTKNIESTFAQTAADPRVRLFANVAVGRDIALDELRDLYDAVVLAIGAPLDAPLDVPGHDLPGVYGAAEFVGWYNGHPDFAGLDPNLDTPGAVIVGNGNVAIDIARILAKSIAELSTTDIADHALEKLTASSVRNIAIAGRRGAVEAKFTNVELAELREMENAVAITDGAALPETVGSNLSPRDLRVKEKNLRCFHDFSRANPASRPRRIDFLFHARPVAIIGPERATAIRFERMSPVDGTPIGTGQHFEVPCGLVVSAIGYRSAALAGLADASRRETGRLDRGLYSVGWFKRGPSGKIATNRADGEALAATLLAEIEPSSKPGGAALERLLVERRCLWIDFEAWRSIDAEERRTARSGAPRRKLVRLDDMLALVGVFGRGIVVPFAKN